MKALRRMAGMTSVTGWDYWLWPVLLSPFIGSFLGVVIARAQEPGSIVAGRSRCPECGTRLSPLDLVPLLSWLFLRGRCRHCGKSVGAFYPGIELAAAGVALWAAASISGTLLWASCLLGWTLLTLAVATSIDALAVGLSFALLKVNILLASAIIGLVAFAVTAFSFWLGRKVSALFGRWAQLAGGIILIGIGLRIVIMHMVE